MPPRRSPASTMPCSSTNRSSAASNSSLLGLPGSVPADSSDPSPAVAQNTCRRWPRTDQYPAPPPDNPAKSPIEVQSHCNPSAIRGEGPLRPTRRRLGPVEGPKSSPGQEIRPRLHCAIKSGFLYTPPTANATIWLPARSACVGSDGSGSLRRFTRRHVGADALVRSGERPFARLHRRSPLARPGCVL